MSSPPPTVDAFVLWHRLPQGGHRLLAAAALSTLALGILWSLDAVTDTPTTTIVQAVDPWGERGAFQYAPILADGSGELAMGEPGYFTSEAPRLRVLFDWALDDPAAERVAAAGELLLVVRHEKPTWTDITRLAEGTYEGPADGTLALSGEVDLTAVEARLKATPGRDLSSARWAFVANVRFASVPLAEHRADASVFELPLTYTPPLYTLPGADATSSTKDHTRSQVEERDAPSPLAALAARPVGPAFVALGLVGLYAHMCIRSEEVHTA